MATDNQPKPHRLVAQVASWGEVELTVECPYVLGEPRPCNLYEEAKGCTDEDCPHPWLEFGHGHPAEGCYVQHCISEIGWGEAIRWTNKGAPVTVPTDVKVWCDEDGVEMEPWVELVTCDARHSVLTPDVHPRQPDCKQPLAQGGEGDHAG